MLQSVLAFFNSPVRRRFSSSLEGEKRIVFVRHGCTYMNEYLSRHDFGCSSFTDIFPPSEIDKYRDAKLSKLGHDQANGLMNRLQQEKDPWTQELDLIVVSPLTRAIQTFELGIQPVLEDPPPPIMALPLASERVYLISDIGRPRGALQKDYGYYIDFESGFRGDEEDDDDKQQLMLMEEWWFGLDDQRKHSAEPTGITSETYEEWRSGSQNQKYACPGEPNEVFQQRMRRLYEWLKDRPESTIAVVCHCGVIAWFMNRDFENCEVQVVPFSDIRPSTLNGSS